MITVFARNFAIANMQSLYWQETPTPNQSLGSSYLETGYTPQLTLANDALTFSTWIKPDWATGQITTPVTFLHYQANSSQYNALWMGYDAETSSDAIFIALDSTFDGLTTQVWYIAPVSTDFVNAAITGLSSNTNGVGGSSVNSWNGTSLPQFVNITWVITDTGTAAANPGDLSQKARIFWNGQYLRTYEYWSTGNNNWATLDEFRVQQNSFRLGNFIYPRNYWMDKTSLRLDDTSFSDVNTHLYAGGNPTSPTLVSDAHYDFENPSPYDSNAPLALSLTNNITSPAVTHVLAPGIGV